MTSRPTLADLLNASPGSVVGTARILRNEAAKLPGLSGRKSAREAVAGPWGRVLSAEGGRVVLALSIPARVLWPNARPHHMAKAKAVKAHRATAAATVAGLVPEPWERATLRAAWFFPDLRRRDPDGAAASMKATIDGLRDGLLILDDDTRHLTHLGSTFDVDRDCPRVILTIERAD